MPAHVSFLNIWLNKWNSLCLSPPAPLSRTSQSFSLSSINRHDSDKHSEVPVFLFFLLYCFMAPHCQACRHMYFHVIFWRCQKDDRGKRTGGREGHEQEAMPVHLCQCLMETAIVNSYVNMHAAAGHSALQHKNYTYSACIGSDRQHQFIIYKVQ